MKIANAFSLLSTVLIFACYLERIEPEKSSDSSYPSSDSLSPSSSSFSWEIAFQEPIIISGQSYKTIKMNSQIWFAQNLNAIPNSGNWWCYGNNESHCKTYGKLYDWEAATHVCPSGWTLPSRDDYEKLSDFLLSYKNNVLTKDWWNATYGGYRYEDEYDRWYPLDIDGFWWSSTDVGNLAYYCNIKDGENKLHYREVEKKTKGFSVRCIKK